MTMLRVYLEVAPHHKSALLDTLNDWKNDTEITVSDVREIPSFDDADWGHGSTNPVVMFEDHISHVKERVDQLKNYFEYDVRLLLAV